MSAATAPAPPPPPADSSTQVDAVDVKDINAPEGRTWIMLDDNPDIPPTGLPLSVNGIAIMIMTGEPVHVPNRYIEVLDNAITSAPILDAGQKVIGHRDRHRFPYRKVPAPANA